MPAREPAPTPAAPPAAAPVDSRRDRIVTGVVAVALVVGGAFLLPSDAWFVLCVLGFGAAAVEFAAIVRHWAPTAPLRNLLVLVPFTALVLFYLVRQQVATADLGLWLLLGGSLVVLNSALVTLLAGTDTRDAMVAIGLLAFGVPYFALPTVSVYWLQRIDPWLVLLLLLVVALGDTAAYFAGSKLGRRKMAPRVSPNKSWEGAAAGFLTAVAATAAWSLWRLGEVSVGLLVVGAVTAVAAQLGDLVESLIKRGAGVKDSSTLLPGHGGFFDRLDATLLAAPILTTGLWILGFGKVIPEP